MTFTASYLDGVGRVLGLDSKDKFVQAGVSEIRFEQAYSCVVAILKRMYFRNTWSIIYCCAA
jgi:hypothetical protein